jgi:hypothetical protein
MVIGLDGFIFLVLAHIYVIVIMVVWYGAESKNNNKCIDNGIKMRKKVKWTLRLCVGVEDSDQTKLTK